MTEAESEDVADLMLAAFAKGAVWGVQVAIKGHRPTGADMEAAAQLGVEAILTALVDQTND